MTTDEKPVLYVMSGRGLPDDVVARRYSVKRDTSFDSSYIVPAATYTESQALKLEILIRAGRIAHNIYAFTDRTCPNFPENYLVVASGDMPALKREFSVQQLYSYDEFLELAQPAERMPKAAVDIGVPYPEPDPIFKTLQA